MANLTVDEARRRAASVRVDGYRVALDLDAGDTMFESTSTISFDSADGATTFVDVDAAELRSVTLNGDPIAVDTLADGRLALSPRSGANVLVVSATMAYSHDGEGLHRAVDPEDGLAYVYAMAFLDAAPRIFGCFDQPDLKAALDLSARVPDGWLVLGNGRAAQTDPADSPDGRTGWHRLATTAPLSTYFMTLVAGPYHSVLAEHDGIALGLHCRQSLAEYLDKDVDELFEVTGQCFDEYHRLFGVRYPFGDYHQVFVPEFNAGAMENPGCVTFTDEHVFRAQPTGARRTRRASTVAHEMAHQWFGDLVTMRWWDDLWLNESFADYMGHRVCAGATAFSEGWLAFALQKPWGLDADQRASTHPVAGNGAPDAHTALTNFDGISYVKGASVLRQLNGFLGEDAFIAGIVDHLGRHAFGNATLADLIASWERASGRDLSGWTRSWLRTAGVDTLAVRQGSPTVVERLDGSAEPAGRPHAVTVTVYDDSGRSESAPVVLAGDLTEVPLDSSGEGRLVVPDSGDQSWARIRLDPAGVRALPVVLPRIGDPIARAVVWSALRDGLRHAETDPSDYVDVLGAALPFEENDLLVGQVLGTAVGSLGTFVHAAEQQSDVEALAARLLADSPPAGNRQLVVARLFLRACTDAEPLWAWLDGHQPEGLVMDADLRWRVIQRLCSLGRGGEDDIARQQAVDPSSQGVLAALRCRAAMPSPTTKEAVWARIVGDAALSNDQLDALCTTFFQPAQAPVVDPFVDRYFAEMPGTVDVRQGWIVQLSCMRLFPTHAASTQTLRTAESTLAREDVDAFARRAISDGTDDLRLVLASRTAFPTR